VNRRTAFVTFKMRGHGTCVSAESNTAGIEAKVDAFTGQHFVNRRGNVGVFVLDKPRPHLDNRHLRPESPKYLSEFQSDVTSANDQKVRRHGIQFHHRAVRQEWDLVDSWHCRNGCPSADINKDAL